MGETAADAGSVTVTSATTDSREVRPGGLFVAKPGEQADGHLFVPAAFEAGAVLALTEREVRGADGNLTVVTKGLQAGQRVVSDGQYRLTPGADVVEARQGNPA